MANCCNNHLQKYKIFFDHFSILQKRIYALICSKRLLPNYFAFQEKYKIGDYCFLHKYLDYLLSNINYHNIDYSKMVDFYNKIDAICPDTEKFGDTVGLLALDAGIAIANTGLFYGNNNNDNLYLVAEQGVESAEICTISYNVDDDLALSNIFCAEYVLKDYELLKKILNTDFNKKNISAFVNDNATSFDHQYIFDHKYTIKNSER